jgi:YgiT-type zinc finger domain-containing protein
VGESHGEKPINMKCSITGCPGDYEERKILHTVRDQGKVMVIDHVPAEVCPACGDVLLKPETVCRLEELTRKPTNSSGTVPLYEYA